MRRPFAVVAALSCLAAADGDTCTTLQVTQPNVPCASEVLPAAHDTLVQCSATLCSTVLNGWAIVQGANKSEELKGYFYGCEVVPYEGVLRPSLVCEPAPVSCLVLEVREDETCGEGPPVDLEEVSECIPYLCYHAAEAAVYRYSNPDLVLAKNESFCGLVPASGYNESSAVLCATPLSLPPDDSAVPEDLFDPPEAPTPVEPVCLDTYVNTPSTTCTEENRIDNSTFDACRQYICDSIIPQDGVARGAGETFLLFGNLWGCVFVSFNASIDALPICIPAATPPSSDKSLGAGSISAIVLSVLVAVVLIGGLLFWKKRRDPLRYDVPTSYGGIN